MEELQLSIAEKTVILEAKLAVVISEAKDELLNKMEELDNNPPS